MQVDTINPFIAAARKVLMAELDSEVERGKMSLSKAAETSDDVTALIAVTGDVRGLVLYTMSDATACATAARMIGQECDQLDELAQSAIAELANMITGKASVLLEDANVKAEISPPAMVVGAGSSVSTVSLPRLVVPLTTACGGISIHLALEQAA